MLRDSARRLVEHLSPAHHFSAGRDGRSNPAAWQAIVADGWLLAGLPSDPASDLGGFDLGFAATTHILEETAGGLLTEPVLGSLIALHLLSRFGGHEALDAVTQGRLRIALADTEPGARFGTPPTGTRLCGAQSLHGRKQLVLGGGDADLLIVTATDENGQPCVLLVPANDVRVTRQSYPLLDATGAADVLFDDVALSSGAILARGDVAAAAIDYARDIAIVAGSAEAIGAMDAAFQATLAFVKQRVQFGQPIGANQALQHRLVDMLGAIRQAQILLAAAIDAIDSEAGDRGLTVAALKLHTARTARHVGEECVQMHGAIGTTDEAAISHYYRKLITASILFGGAAYHRARFAALDRATTSGNAPNDGLAPDDRAFADEVRRFVAATIDPQTRAIVAAGGHPNREQADRWFQALGERNWLAHTWSRDHGGPGFTPIQQVIFDQVMAEMDAPANNGLGTRLAGPVIREFGTPEQRAQHLPGILRGTVNWCQGYSEPGAGSDLASLTTRADRDGDDYIVNGQKIWTSYAHWADWIFMLVRTSREAKRQAGISFLLVDMTSPGITVRPILAAEGHHGFNEIFFDDVRVPIANRIGEEGQGWTCAKFLLSHERLGVVSLPNIRRAMAAAERAAHHRDASGRRLIDDPAFEHRLVDLKVRLRAVEGWVGQLIAQVVDGGSPGIDVSMLKIAGTELHQAIVAFTLDAAGYDALPFLFETGATPTRTIATPPAFVERAAAQYIGRRVSTILGGSTEIQKNILSKTLLGL